MPKKYVEKVGDDGFKKAPVGAGPYKFVLFTPGVELVLEAFDDYWRKMPRVKRLVFRVIPEEVTRLAALKRGEVDIAYSIRGELADEVQHTPGLTLKPTVISAPYHLYFPEQWDLQSPWHDQRVREAASVAIDRAAINQALTLGTLPSLGAPFRKTLSSTGSLPHQSTTRKKQRSCWQKQAIRMALTLASIIATSPTQILVRPCLTIWVP